MKESTHILLFQSEFFRLHPASIVTIAEFTLSLLILIYFLSLKGKTKDTWLMIGYIGLAMLVYLIDIGVTSSKTPVYLYFRISHFILISVWTLFGTWCAYTYRGYSLRREGVGVILVESLILGGISAYLILKNLLKFNIMSLYYVIIALQAWSTLVLLRRSRIALNHRNDSSATIRTNLPTLVELTAQSMCALALLFVCWILSFLGTMVTGSPLVYHIGQMVLLLGVLVAHLNYASEETTFQVKLVSLPLATTLALLGILPFLLFGVESPELTGDFIDSKLEQQLRVFAWFIPGSSAFILVAFVLFYWVGLFKPLRKLIEGVQRIEAGDLHLQVPVLTRDEIGHFSHSLNTMAASLKASQEELESRVVERTKELQASLVRLQSTQAQLIQSEKMASLGELTAGIAHEIQNPLNFVNNFSEVNKELLDEIENEINAGNKEEVISIVKDIKENEEKINHHGKRADAIVKGMLQHSRSTAGVKEPTDINALTHEYLRLSYHGLRAKDNAFNATLQTDFNTSIEKINIIPQDIGRVFLNLFNNAFYAVAEKKKQLGDGYEPTVSVTTLEMNGKVEIKINDNGNGIPKIVLEKIFQPFFTTKPTGQGTGLGLSLAYDVIKAHGGDLKVKTKEGEGAEFIIQLPAFDLI